MISFLGRNDLPRGLRNNNPGNLQKTKIAWQGKIPHAQNTDSRFEQFADVVKGLRAMATDIANDIAVKKLNTITALVTEYAPPHENDTTNYINQIAKAVNASPVNTITLTNKLLEQLVIAKVKMENGPKAVAKHWPTLAADVTTAINSINAATKKRLTWVTPSISGIIFIAGLFFLARSLK